MTMHVYTPICSLLKELIVQLAIDLGLAVPVVVASAPPSGSVKRICIFAGTSMAGLSSAVHVTVTLDPATPSGLVGSLIRVTETG